MRVAGFVLSMDEEIGRALVFERQVLRRLVAGEETSLHNPDEVPDGIKTTQPFRLRNEVLQS